MNNLVSLSQFNLDLANDQLPNFSYLVPNLLDDAHDGPLQLGSSCFEGLSNAEKLVEKGFCACDLKIDTAEVARPKILQ